MPTLLQVVEALATKLTTGLQEYVRPRVVARSFIEAHSDYAGTLNDVLIGVWRRATLGCQVRA